MKVKILDVKTINLMPENEAETALLNFWTRDNSEVGFAGYSSGESGLSSFMICSNDKVGQEKEGQVI
jgi:hypothetical protein